MSKRATRFGIWKALPRFALYVETGLLRVERTFLSAHVRRTGRYASVFIRSKWSGNASANSGTEQLVHLIVICLTTWPSHVTNPLRATSPGAARHPLPRERVRVLDGCRAMRHLVSLWKH